MKIGLTIFLVLFYITNVFAEYDSVHQAYDYIPDINYAEIADRMGCLDTEIPLTFNKTVKSFIDYFSVRNRDYTRGVLEKKDYYFSIIEPYLKEHGLPDDLKYLAIVESGLVPRAQSRAGAVGLWQFMPSTGRSYGLSNSWYIDDRMDPNQATDAACRYLKSLYNTFGRWDLAIAAYNCGPGNVRKAIRRSGYKKDFWEVYRYLPRETRSYVPQFAAIFYSMEFADEHNIFVEDIEFPIEHEVITTNQFVYLKAFADESGINLSDLKKLNPAIKKGAIPASAKNYQLRIPKNQADDYNARTPQILAKAKAGKTEFEKMAKNMPGSTFGKEKTIYRVRSGDVLGTIAQRHKVRVADLRSWNNIRGSMIRVGQRLTIYSGPDFYEPSQSKSQTVRNQPLPNSKTHVVQPGDTLWDISRMYKGLTIQIIKQLNNLKTDRLEPGVFLKIG
jgi:membrane-bound lytic murein transglycosylase D